MGVFAVRGDVFHLADDDHLARPDVMNMVFIDHDIDELRLRLFTHELLLGLDVNEPEINLAAVAGDRIRPLGITHELDIIH